MKKARINRAFSALRRAVATSLTSSRLSTATTPLTDLAMSSARALAAALGAGPVRVTVTALGVDVDLDGAQVRVLRQAGRYRGRGSRIVRRAGHRGACVLDGIPSLRPLPASPWPRSKRPPLRSCAFASLVICPALALASAAATSVFATAESSFWPAVRLSALSPQAASVRPPAANKMASALRDRMKAGICCVMENLLSVDRTAPCGTAAANVQPTDGRPGAPMP